MLRQQSYAIKNQLVAKIPPTRGICCSSLVLYGIRIVGFHARKGPIKYRRQWECWIYLAQVGYFISRNQSGKNKAQGGPLTCYLLLGPSLGVRVTIVGSDISRESPPPRVFNYIYYSTLNTWEPLSDSTLHYVITHSRLLPLLLNI